MPAELWPRGAETPASPADSAQPPERLGFLPSLCYPLTHSASSGDTPDKGAARAQGVSVVTLRSHLWREAVSVSQPGPRLRDRKSTRLNSSH